MYNHVHNNFYVTSYDTITSICVTPCTLLKSQHEIEVQQAVLKESKRAARKEILDSDDDDDDEEEEEEDDEDDEEEVSD